MSSESSPSNSNTTPFSMSPISSTEDMNDYFSVGPDGFGRQIPQRSNSAAHNQAMREIIKDWASIPPSPPACQAVSYSSWTRFKPCHTRTKSSEEMRASVLWTPTGTTPDFNPPILERTHLGIDQDDQVAPGKPTQLSLRGRHRRPKTSLQSSWTTEDEDMGSATSAPVTFKKQLVTGNSASFSLLTASLKDSRESTSLKQVEDSPMSILGRKLNGLKLSASMLPSAFDSDSESDDVST